MRTTHDRTSLLTGATGFLGHFLLRDLLAAGRRVVVVLRGPLSRNLPRLGRMLAALGVNLNELAAAGRVVAAEGGLPGPLPEPHWGGTDEIVHCAASLQLFLNGNRDPFGTNLDGAKALIDWAQRHGVPAIHAVSTAYVCGMNVGLIREEFHSPKPEFQTDYEHSKWLAEREFDRWGQQAGNSLTIWRPSFVVGDSQSGFTTQYRGFYQLARLVSMLKHTNGQHTDGQHTDGQHGNGQSSNGRSAQGEHAGSNGADTYVPLRIPLHPEGRHNVVPVDFAARMVVAGVTDPSLQGRIYHLTDPDPPTNDFWKRCFEEFFHLHGGYFVDPRRVNGARSDEEAMLWEQIDVLVPRLHHTPQFDQHNTASVLRERGWTYPTLDHERVGRLLRYAVGTGWGKRSNGVRV